MLEDALQAALHDSDLKSQSADQAAASFRIADNAMISLCSCYPSKTCFVWKANLRFQVFPHPFRRVFSSWPLEPGNPREANLALRRMAIKAQAAGMHSLLVGNREANGLGA